MKICLFALNSSYVHTNLAVRCLARSLRDHGHEAIIAEYTLKDRRDAVLYRLVSEKADIYGFSCYIWNIEDMCRFAALLKAVLPNAAIVFGGPEVSFEDESFFGVHPYTDFLIRGEGEDAIVKLCTDVAGGDFSRRIYDGNAYSGFDGAGILYDKAPSGRIAYYESSRGCPYSCAFCLSSVTSGVRAKSAALTLKELKEFERFPDIKIIKLVDRTFNFDRERAKEIWRGLLSDDYSLSYHFEICGALLDEESFALLERFPSGEIQLEMGVQSTCRETLNAVCRRDDSTAVIEAAKKIMSFGSIHVHCDLIAGLPHESYERFGQSFDDVYGCANMLQLGFLKLLRGSALRRDADLYGIKYEPSPPYTVLETADISFEQLHRLKMIAALLDRCVSSGAFEQGMKYLTLIGSPFAFFNELYDYISTHDGRYIADIPQNLMYEYIYRFGAERTSIEERILRSCLRFDYLLHEIHSLPAFLRSNDNGRFANEIAEKHKKSGSISSSAAGEPHIFEFDPNYLYLINRRSHSYKKISVV